jgi:hypothetical protein
MKEGRKEGRKVKREGRKMKCICWAIKKIVSIEGE